MKKVIIFDYDGVIIDSLNLFMDQFLSACQIEGWTQINSKQSFLQLFDGNMYENMMKLGMNKADILGVVTRVKKGLIENEETLKAFPHMKEILESLAKKHILLISTSNDSTVVKRFLQLNNLTFFKEIYGSDKHHSKIKKIAFIKKQFPHAEYFYVGDTIGDILEGKKANVKTIAVTWGWHDSEKLSQVNPDFRIHKPNELLNIFS